MDLNEEQLQPLYKIIEENFAERLDKIRDALKSKETFKVEFLNCELSNKIKCINFVFNVNGIQTAVGIDFDEIVSENFENIFHKVLALLLLVNGGK